MLVGNMNRQELGHKCVEIPRIVALYILVDRLLFSLAHDNTSVYNMTSEAPHEHEYLQFLPDTLNHLLACLFTFRVCIYEWVHPAGRVRHYLKIHFVFSVAVETIYTCEIIFYLALC